MDVNRISGYIPGKIVFFLMQVCVGHGASVQGCPNNDGQGLAYTRWHRMIRDRISLIAK